MVLVTGGAGYIGSVLIRQLLDKGEAIRVFDKLFFTDIGLKDVLDKIELIQGDIREFDGSLLNGVDSVIHLGGLSNDPTAEYNPKANYEMNTVATKTLATLCKKRDVNRFVFASSCSIYDLGFYAEDFLRDETSEVKPRAAYAVSKYEAERELLKLKGDGFCPVILRQGTVYGFSPRMRYDLVVNTFVKDALMNGILNVKCGGEMWRPLVDVQDAARAFICLSEAAEDRVCGEVFNLVYENYRISELALRVREALKGIKEIKVEMDYSSFKSRSYRVSGQKIESVLSFKPSVPAEDSVKNMVKEIKRYKYTDFLNPKYYNIQWMTLLDGMEGTLKKIKGVF